jgi:hypothetical protein
MGILGNFALKKFFWEFYIKIIFHGTPTHPLKTNHI